MAYVMTVDQIASRRRRDLVAATMDSIRRRLPDASLTRTVGDEFQLLASDPASVVDVILLLMRRDDWHVGLGIGTVEAPVPTDLREARGSAFLAAREAVEEAKSRPDHLRVVAAPPAAVDASDAEVLLGVLLALRARRSQAGWAATDLADTGLTQAEIADRLGVSRQAVGQRLQTAGWTLDRQAQPVAARLLARADERAVETAAAPEGRSE